MQITDEEIAAFDAKLAAEFRALREERDALRALVECATEFEIGDRVVIGNMRKNEWWMSDGAGDYDCIGTRDEAIAKARKMVKEDT